MRRERADDEMAAAVDEDPAQVDGKAFEELHALVKAMYPRAHRALGRERVAGLSLLYTWPGSDPSLEPVLLAGHQDVVPIDRHSEGDWTHPPFEGVVEDGVVWGRGAIDDKGALVAILEAVEHLVREGFEPRRTVYLAFGHDEEVGGDVGAAGLAAHLAAQGVRLRWVLDEGGVVAADYVPGIEKPVAVVGIAEKGSVSIALELDAPGGHSSVPPRSSAIGELARVVARLEDHPLPARIDGVTALFLERLAPELPLAARVVLASRRLFDPLLRVGFARIGALDAMQRTTTAVTIFESGVQENVLPVKARAVVDFRVHTHDRIAGVVEHVRRVVDDDRVHLEVGVGSLPREASSVSPASGEAWDELERSIREVFPSTPVVPFLVVGGTDARHYEPLSEHVYRFSPFVFDRSALHLAHGTDERISRQNLVRAVGFYVRLLRNAAGGPASPAP